MFDNIISVQARARPQAPAIVTPQDRLSFARFDADIDRAAWALRSLDPGEDGSVAVEVADPYFHWLVLLALARLGIASAAADDVESRLRISDRPDSDAAITLTDALRDEIVAGPKRAIAPRRPPPDALGRVFRSSGTTGEPKRVPSSWHRIDLGVHHVPMIYGAAPGPWHAATGPDNILGFIAALGAWAGGNPLLLGLGGPLTGALLQSTRPALVAMVPDQLAALLDRLASDLVRHPLRVVTAGSALPPALARRTRKQLTGDIRSLYGTSESGTIAIATPPHIETVAGAAGFVLPTVELEIVDDAGSPLPTGARGYVRVRGERVVSGYIGDPARSARTFRDGWLWPGDIGRIDAAGLLVIEGRADDIMNLGGRKIMPGEVEAAARAAPGVRDVAAFALADGDGIERCWLALVTGPEFNERALGEAVLRELSWMKRIRWIAVDRLPRNAMGKVARLELRKLAAAQQAKV